MRDLGPSGGFRVSGSMRDLGLLGRFRDHFKEPNTIWVALPT